MTPIIIGVLKNCTIFPKTTMDFVHLAWTCIQNLNPPGNRSMVEKRKHGELASTHLSRVFFPVSGLYTFLLPTLCLRFAYAVAVSAYARLLCLDLPTRAYAYRLIFNFAYSACIWCLCVVCVLSCLFMFCLRRFHLVPIR